MGGSPNPPDMLSAPILVLGAPRSGTTWLAKILDSHPDVLYRHEPDDVFPGEGAALSELLARWGADRTPRTVTKRPFFRKSWQPGPAFWLRTALANAISAAARLPEPFKALGRLPVPDFAMRPPSHIVIKSIDWAERAPELARSVPGSRVVFILRHPCGQVDSVMRGNRQRRFDLKTEGTDMPFDEARAVRFAARFGVGDPAFQALPDAAKYAWSWRAFNEPAYAAMAARPNVQIVLYEALCADPQQLSRQILAFAGLSWNRQTEDFVTRSADHPGDAGYYAIFRDAAAAARAWRTRMTPEDQAAVRSVIVSSPLARFWPD